MLRILRGLTRRGRSRVSVHSPRDNILNLLLHHDWSQKGGWNSYQWDGDKDRGLTSSNPEEGSNLFRPAAHAKSSVPLPAHVGPRGLPTPVPQFPVPLGFPFAGGGFLSHPLRAHLCSLSCRSGPPFPLPAAGGCPRGAGGAGPRGPRGRRCRGHRDDADAVSAGAAHVRGLRRQALELLYLPFAEADPHGNSVSDCSI